MEKSLSRRYFLRMAGLGAAGAALAACAQPTPAPQVIKETVVVAGTPQVNEKVVVATQAPAAATKVTITETATIDNQKQFTNMAEGFNKKYAGKIVMEVKNVPSAGWGEKFLAMIAANDGPDCWYAGGGPLDYPKRGFMQNLTPYFQRDNLKPDELWFQIAKRDVWQGNWYHMPGAVYGGAFSYNKNICDEMGAGYPKDGWTFDDFLTWSIKVRSKEKGYWANLFAGQGAPLWGSLSMPYNCGLWIISDDGRKVQGLMDSQQTIDMIQWFIDLQVKYDLCASGNDAQALGACRFCSGKLALGGAQEGRQVDQDKIKWDVVRAPRYKDFKEYGWNDCVSWYMWSGAKHKDEVWEVLKYVGSPEGTKIRFTAPGTEWAPSPCPSVWKELGYDKREVDKVWAILFGVLNELPGTRPSFGRSEHWGKCVGPNWQGIWAQYIEEKKRPLADIVKKAAADSQKCLDEMYSQAG